MTVVERWPAETAAVEQKAGGRVTFRSSTVLPPPRRRRRRPSAFLMWPPERSTP